jgi:heme exporter protein C
MKDFATFPDASAAAPRGTAQGARWWWRYASPQHVYPLAGRLWPWFAALAVLATALGLYIGFFVAPTDHQQGDAYRIIYLHVPAAWLAMLIYLAMAFWSAVGLVLGTRVSFMMARALAPTGALFAVLTLWTGSLWGRPTWGTWWVWDARLTSVVILLFLYIGFIALQAAMDDPRKADKAGALLALVGAVNVPIIYFSVQWWNTLHQGSSINLKGSSMATVMLAGMLVTTLGLWAYSIAAVLARLRAIVLERERHADWVSRLPEVRA